MVDLMMLKSCLLILFLQVLIFSISNAQNSVTVSGYIKDKKSKVFLPYVSVALRAEKDSSFVCGTVSNEEGRFEISKVKSGNYILEFSFIGYAIKKESLFVGHLTQFLDIKTIELEEISSSLQEVLVAGSSAELSQKMDKKTFSLEDNISQSGGSVLQAIQNLPSITVKMERYS
jgi:hypothetical protein